jgi:hypothetical protein
MKLIILFSDIRSAKEVEVCNHICQNFTEEVDKVWQ